MGFEQNARPWHMVNIEQTNILICACRTRIRGMDPANVPLV